MSYQVQRGDTISKVTQIMNTDWKTLRRLNPQAVGRSARTGNWFLKEGAALKGPESFESVLKQAEPKNTSGPPQVPSEAVSPHRSSGNKATGKWTHYTIRPGDTLWTLAVRRFCVNLEDIVRDNAIKDPDKIRPGQTIQIRRPSFDREQRVVASWYGAFYHGRSMANGDPYDMHADTIAHKKLPFGTRVEFKNPETGQTARAVVTDRGPFVAGRDVDLSYGLAKKLSFVERGVGRLVMRILG